MDLIKHLSEYVKLNWHKPKILIIGFAIYALVLCPILCTAKVNWKLGLFIYFASLIGISIYWYFEVRVPKNKKGKIGFIVAIRFPDNAEEAIIREDFIGTLKKLLYGGNIGNSFNLIETKKHISDSIENSSDANTILFKSKSHFILFGKVILRTIEGKQYHIFELEAIVSHTPIPNEVSNILSQELTELFPRNVRIDRDNLFEALTFTSKWAGIVARYIIGIAAYVSGDVNYAQELFLHVDNDLKNPNDNFPIYQKLKTRIPLRLTDIYVAKSHAYLRKWEYSRDEKYLIEVNNNVRKIPSNIESYSIWLLQSIVFFIFDRDVDKAIKVIKKCKKIDDPIWRFNLAFLKAFNKDLKSAIREYKICERYPINPVTLDEVESFLEWVIETEPQNYQLYYCLGFFNWRIKGDFIQAKNDFDKFLEYRKDGEFDTEAELTKKWISEIAQHGPMKP